MRHPPIFHLVLNELKSRQTNLIERLVVRSARISNADGRSAEVVEWSKPGFKHGPHSVIPLQIHAADFTRAIVVIEVAGQFGVRRLELHSGRIAEVLFNISTRSEY